MQIQFLEANSAFPGGRVSNTVRLGDKWFNQVEVGQVLDLVKTETGEVFGRAVVVSKALEPLEEVLLWHAEDNHATTSMSLTGEWARNELVAALKRAYPVERLLDSKFTILDLLPLREEA